MKIRPLLSTRMPGKNIAGMLPVGWERCETIQGIPFYKNHEDQLTQWEHPLLFQLFKELESFQSIKYAAYRTALKLHSLQALTNLHMIDGSVLDEMLTDVGFDETSTLFVSEVEALFSKLFSSVVNLDSSLVEQSTELSLNWALKCYDSGRTGQVLLRSLKIGLILLSEMAPEDKYIGLFNTASTNNPTMSKIDFASLLSDMLMLPDCLGESGTFSNKDILGSVESCLHTEDNLTRDSYVCWMRKEPQLLVWLPTLHRIVTAESVKHEAKCTVCKAYPILGLRYRCLKCLNTDLCQSCYWTQRSTRVHKFTHPVREYCMTTTSGDDVKDFVSQMRNKFTRQYRRHGPKKTYLSQTTCSADKKERSSESFARLHLRVTALASKLSERDDSEVNSRPMSSSSSNSSNNDDTIISRHYSAIIDGLQQEKKQLEEQLLLQCQIHSTINSGNKTSTSSIKPTFDVKVSSITGGLSVSTLDDWAFVLGGEEERLQEMTDLLLKVFVGQDSSCLLEPALLVAAQEIERAMSLLTNEVEISVYNM